MQGVFRIGVCVAASALALVMALGARVETQSGVIDAPAGFDVASNGFAEEFCARQDAADGLAEFADDSWRRMQFRRRSRGVHRTGNR